MSTEEARQIVVTAMRQQSLRKDSSARGGKVWGKIHHPWKFPRPERLTRRHHGHCAWDAAKARCCLKHVSAAFSSSRCIAWLWRGPVGTGRVGKVCRTMHGIDISDDTVNQARKAARKWIAADL